MKKPVNPFSLYNKKPSSIKYGKLYTASFNLSVPHEKKRLVRVYLPEDYRKDKKYPVLFMSDGQELFDKYTCTYDYWKLDLRMHEMIKEGYNSFIIVGIDCPKDPVHRITEYSFSQIPYIRVTKYGATFGPNLHAYGDEFLGCLVRKIKPVIDNCFSTSGLYGIGGSSMGGVFALNGWLLYPEIFTFCLSFSPAYCLYSSKNFYDYISRFDINKFEGHSLALYTGTYDFEKQFFMPSVNLYNYYDKLGFDDKHLGLFIDSLGTHVETSWSAYFQKAMSLWIPKKNKSGKIK